MREKPDIPDAALATALQTNYHINATAIAFLPLGADHHSAVYRVDVDDGRAAFLKLRSGAFDDIGVAVSRLLYERGIRQVIPPLPTTHGAFWTRVGQFALMAWPFIEGRDGYRAALTDAQWLELADAIASIHGSQLPEPLAGRVPRDTFASDWRDAVSGYIARGVGSGCDSAAKEAGELVRASGTRIAAAVARAELLAGELRARELPVTLCHGDMHAGNVLISADDRLYVLDWDTLELAPPERDLEQIGGRWGDTRTAALFYKRYPRKPDLGALAYYRYRRVVEDIAVDCAALLDTLEGGENRAQTLVNLRQCLEPGGALDQARSLDQAP